MGDMAELYDYMPDRDDDAPMEVECPYCGKEAKLVTGDVIYPHRPDLEEKLFYHCKPCDAYVGTHVKTGEPYGRLANKELRAARNKAHMFFDKLWKYSYSRMTRKEAYAWLAHQMGLLKDDCHIGDFDVQQCNKVAELARKKLNEKR